MIKKTIYTVALMGLFTIPSIAQTTDITANDSTVNNTEVSDSLQQTINALETEKKQLEKEALDKKIWKNRAKYFNISYVKQSLSIEDANCTWNNNIGAGITWGRTYYLHKKPILGMIKFGLDWSFLDINFSMYEEKFGIFGGGDYGDEGNYYNPSEEYPGYGYNDGNYDDYEDGGYEKMYQAEIGMQFGPSVTVNPIDHLKINGYFRVTPSYSIFYNSDDIHGSYGTFFSVGGAISYKAISLGVEGRWGSTKYKSFFGEDEGDDEDYDEEYTEATPKFKTGSTRVYISFRF